MNQSLRKELLEMAAEDRKVRQELVADGTLWEGYHPRMEELHRRHASRLDEIVDAHGWPGSDLVGEDGAEAAWLILQHAIGNPSLQRRCLELLKDAAEAGHARPDRVAALEDRIRVLEGRPQLYGTELDWDESSELSPHPIEDALRVDTRRRSVGLGPLEKHIAACRARAEDEGEKPPADVSARREKMDAWARSVGWRDG